LGSCASALYWTQLIFSRDKIHNRNNPIPQSARGHAALFLVFYDRFFSFHFESSTGTRLPESSREFVPSRLPETWQITITRRAPRRRLAITKQKRFFMMKTGKNRPFLDGAEAAGGATCGRGVQSESRPTAGRTVVQRSENLLWDIKFCALTPFAYCIRPPAPRSEGNRSGFPVTTNFSVLFSPLFTVRFQRNRENDEIARAKNGTLVYTCVQIVYDNGLSCCGK